MSIKISLCHSKHRFLNILDRCKPNIFRPSRFASILIRPAAGSSSSPATPSSSAKVKSRSRSKSPFRSFRWKTAKKLLAGAHHSDDEGTHSGQWIGTLRWSRLSNKAGLRSESNVTMLQVWKIQTEWICSDLVDNFCRIFRKRSFLNDFLN